MTLTYPHLKAAPPDSWPLPDRANWPSYAGQLGNTHRRAVARIYGLFVSYCELHRRDLDTAAALGFFEEVELATNGSTPISKVNYLIVALSKLRPNVGMDWFALREALRGIRHRRGPTYQPKGRNIKRTWSIRFEEWPAEYKALWHAAVQKNYQQQEHSAETMPEDEEYYMRIASSSVSKKRNGRTKGVLSDATMKRTRKLWCSWLWWCRNVGRIDPADITEGSVRQFVATLQSRDLAETTMAMRVMELHYAGRLLFPEYDWQWLGRLATIMNRRARPATDKSKVATSIEEVIELGIDLFLDATNTNSKLEGAIQARDGLMIALLGWRPVRLSNLQSMDVGEHLRFDSSGQPDKLYYPYSKNNRPISFPIPDFLKTPIMEYLRHYRPHLHSNQLEGPLWPNRHGDKLSSGQIGRKMAATFKSAFGKQFGPHMIRTIYAGSLAEKDPEFIEAIQVMLSHRDRRSISAYLTLAQSSYASSVLQREQDKIIKIPGPQKRKTTIA